MIKLELDFTDNLSPELLYVKFEYNGEIYESYRRKEVAVRDNCGSFQWTSAIKALSSLAIGTKITALDRKESYFLSGEKNSPAASLDYAISKPTEWIVEMFGRLKSGELIAKRIFRRENSERKRSGPVTIRLVKELNIGNRILIRIGGKELNNQSALLSLHDLLSSKKIAQNNPPSTQPNWFTTTFIQDASSTLKSRKLLERFGIEERAQIFGLYSGKKYLPAIKEIKQLLLDNIPSSPDRYRSVLKDKITTSIKARASIFPGASGAITLLLKMQEVFPALEIDTTFPSTSAMIDFSLKSKKIELLTLSWGAAIKHLSSLKRAGFKAVALLPYTTFEFVDWKGASRSKQKQFYIAGDSLGYPAIGYRYLSDTQSRKFLHSSASLIEIVNNKGKVDGATILSFPYSQYIFRKDRSARFKSLGDCIGDNILFLGPRCSKKSAELIIRCIHSSWLDLLAEPQSIERISRKFLKTGELWRSLCRVGGTS